jgi:Glycosyl hydrolase family 26
MTRTSRSGRWPHLAFGRPLAAVAIALSCAVALAGCMQPGFDQASATSSLPPAHGTLPTRADSYLGVYEPSAPASYGQIDDFATKVRRKPNLDLFFSGWGEAFTTSFAQTAYRNGAIPYIDIDPGKISVAGIAAGLQDDFLRRYAASVRRFHHPVVISFGHEANGDWYPWGYRHVPPAVWVSAWRHIVTIFRQSGADNVTWLWIMNHEATGEGPIQDWWPGGAYVNWVGIDGYYDVPSDNFESIFGPTIATVRKMTNKPILISETAVGPVAGRAAKIPNLFAGVRANHLLGLVWFDKSQHQGIHHQAWRIEGHAQALRQFSRQAQAYRLVTPDRGSTT